jgi:hypothetical protein
MFKSILTKMVPILALIGVLIGVKIGFSGCGGEEIDYLQALKEADLSSKQVLIKSSDGSYLEATQTAEVYSTILNLTHHMANSLIIAEDGKIWGQEEVTAEKSQLIVEILERYQKQFSGVEFIRLTEIHKRWVEGDYSYAVEDHNYVWLILKGEVGRANEIRPKYRIKNGKELVNTKYK